MSEIKITLDSLENAILRDGLIVSGYIDNSGLGSINASGYGSHAEGYINRQSGIINASGNGSTIIGAYVNNDSSIIIGGKGSTDAGLAGGIADEFSSINLDNWGSIAYGMARINSSINVGHGGAVAFGQANTNSAINANGNGAFASGYAYNGGTINASGNGAHTDGFVNNGTINAFGNGAHAEGYTIVGRIDASKNGAHAEGYALNGGIIMANGFGAHAEGHTIAGRIDASGNGAHAEGINTQALANGAHAGGIGTIANKEAMTAIGKYNNTSVGRIGGDYLFVVGNGTASATASRSNAFAVTTNGITASTLNLSGGKYQEEYDPDPETFHPGGKITWSDGRCYIEETDIDELTINTSNNLYLKSDKGNVNINTSDKRNVNINTNTIISGTAKAKVNDVPNVLLGLPIGSMTMWLGASVWSGYNYAVENYTDYIPDGWLLANGASVRLRYIGYQPRDMQPVTTFHNNTDYVYIPRYTNDSTHDNDFDHWDKFELVAYRHTEQLWVAINGEQSKFNRPNDCYVYMSSNEKQIFTRFLNHVILSTRVYIKTNGSTTQPSYDSLITKDTSYNNVDSTKDSYYLESYTNSTRYTLTMLSWYTNPVTYKNENNNVDDILIALPDMNLKFPLGARQGYINRNFGDVSTMLGNPGTSTHYANTFIGASGGEERHRLTNDEITPTTKLSANNVGITYAPSTNNESHNNIPPYMAVHFIIKYK